MNIIYVKNLLLSFFLENDYFDMDIHSEGILLGKELDDLKKDLLRTALTDLESTGMLKKILSKKKECWFLTRDLNSFHQSVVLSPNTIEYIANTINSFREANSIIGNACDKTKITETDILGLVSICHSLADNEISRDIEGFEDESENK